MISTATSASRSTTIRLRGISASLSWKPLTRQRASPSAPFRQRRLSPSKGIESWRLYASEVDDEVEIVEEADLDSSYLAVLSREDLPKGQRREVMVDGNRIVVFWYRNEIVACESRSPAEGAFSTGFVNANFTEDYGIICPGTNTVFSLKTGEILEWYPTNVVLRSIIPQDTCRNLEVYPVKITKDAIYISFKSGNQGGVRTMRSRGGAKTSLEENNVFGLEPRVYYEGSEAGSQSVEKTTSASSLQGMNPATVLIGTIAVAIVAVSGTALAIYYESIPGLIVFWVVLFGIVAYTISQTLGIFEEKPSSS